MEEPLDLIVSLQRTEFEGHLCAEILKGQISVQNTMLSCTVVDWIPWKVVSSLSVALFEHKLENLFLRVPWTVRRSNQSILREINPEYPLEGLMLKLKLQCFGHLMQRVNSLEKTLMLGKIEGRRKRDDRGWVGWMASSTQWTWVWASSGRWWRTGKPGVLQSTGSQRVGHDWATEQQWGEEDSYTRTLILLLFSFGASLFLLQASWELHFSFCLIWYTRQVLRGFAWFICCMRNK